MNYPVTTSAQLRAVLRSLRQSRHLSQEELGRVLGVSQKRVARIEAVPGRTSFDQITRLAAALGVHLVIEVPSTASSSKPASSGKKLIGKSSLPPTPKTAAKRSAKKQANW